MDRRRFDGGRDRRADGEAQFFACAARDQRIQRESAVERHAIDRSFRRDRVKVELQDGLAGHRELLNTLRQSDVHNVFAYLETLK